MLPNFFIVGAPKAGTTSLYHYLKKHPQVYMSPIKEPNFFSFEETVKQNLYYKEKGIENYEEYQKLFSGVNNEKAVGEASVSYLFYSMVPRLIKETVGDAKIIILLRNPVDRAFSHYYMDCKFRYIKRPFEDVLYQRTNGAISKLYYQQYIELGLYYNQVKRYIDIFGRSEVKIFLYEEIELDIKKVITEVFDFLGVDKTFTPDLNKKYNSYLVPRNSIVSTLYSQRGLRNVARRILPKRKIERIKKIFFSDKKNNEVKIETISYMRELYKPDIQKLESLLDLNLNQWYE